MLADRTFADVAAVTRRADFRGAAGAPVPKFARRGGPAPSTHRATSRRPAS
jgi:hypothetical protein